MEGINAIIFDLGNVIIDLHYERSANELSRLSGKSRSVLDDLLVTDDLLQQFEVGSISEAEFRSGMCALLGISITDTDFDRIWNALLGEVSTARVEKLVELKSSHKTFILSNTNSIHLCCFDKILAGSSHFGAMSELVDKAFYSHEIGMRKPNVESYQYVMESEVLDPNTTLFIDDRQDNIGGANRLGIRTYWNQQVDDWMKLFS